MSKKQKLTLGVVAVAELAVIIFCLVSSILVLTSGYSSAADKESWIASHPGMIGWMCANPLAFFFICVFPSILLFIVDGIYLILYATKKESLLSKEEKDAITEEAKRQAKEEILKELREEDTSASKNE